MNTRSYKGRKLTGVQMMTALTLGVLEVIILHAVGDPGLALAGSLIPGLSLASVFTRITAAQTRNGDAL